MKKVLIATTALATVALGSAAALAEAPALTISGAVDIVFSVADNDGSTGTADGAGLGIGNSSTQLIFDWKGSSDNGLTYGARLDYRFQNANVDEQYIYLSGSWGALHIGGDDGVIGNNIAGGEAVLAGEAGYPGDNLAFTEVGNAAVTDALDNDTDDAMKFSYYSPTYSGFSFGASYIPDVNNGAATTGSGINNSGANGAAQGDSPQFEGTLAYAGSFDAVEFAAGIGYASQEGGEGFEDSQGMELGATASFAAFSVGLGYIDNFDTGCAANANCEAGDIITAGVAYNYGPGSVSLGYALAEQDIDGNGDDESNYIALDADYSIAEGLQGYAGLHGYWSEDASTSAQNSGMQALLGLTVSF